MAEPKILKVFGYVRCSTDIQVIDRNNNSIVHQREQIKKYCEQMGYILLRTFEDSAISGKSMERPKLKEMLILLNMNKADAVVVYKIDRLSRTVKDFTTMIDTYFKTHGFISITEKFDTSTAAGMCFMNMSMCFAQMEREMASERTKSTLQAMKARGLRTGYIPYGKMLDKDKKTLIDCPYDIETYDMIIEMREGQKMEYRQICTKLEELGRTNKKGNTNWYPTVVMTIYKRFK